MTTNQNMTSEIVSATLKVHEACEDLASIMAKAKADRRYRFLLTDARAFRDLADDSENLITRAWRDSLEIPVEVPKIINQLK